MYTVTVGTQRNLYAGGMRYNLTHNRSEDQTGRRGGTWLAEAAKRVRPTSRTTEYTQ